MVKNFVQNQNILPVSVPKSVPACIGKLHIQIVQAKNQNPFIFLIAETSLLESKMQRMKISLQ